jgi:aminopeptidase-like protein
VTATRRPDIIGLVRDLCRFATGVVAPDNEAFFERVGQELPLKLHRYPSGSTHNGWVVPRLWRVHRAVVSRDGRPLFDGTASALGVATYSRSFQGAIDYDELRRHVVTSPTLPDAYVYHCMWQYRPWAADWALSVPYRVFEAWGPGRYDVDLVTSCSDGDMLVGEYEVAGTSPETLVFNAHTCHPRMANDDFAGVAVLIRLFQWLAEQETRYSYRLVLAPEHVGTVFYLRDRTEDELQRLVAGAFAEMPGTPDPIKVASSFLGNRPIDRAFAHAVRHGSRAWELVPWRRGAGNDETVWEAPGYEIPFVEVSRARDYIAPYPEYHTSLDGPDLMDEERLHEFYGVFQRVVDICERNARPVRQFTGLICLSNPEYDLYFERPDPSVVKDLDAEAEKWGHLLDCLLRYFDGSMTILDIAERHDLPFDALRRYLERFHDRGLIRLEPASMERPAISPLGARAGA